MHAQVLHRSEAEASRSWRLSFFITWNEATLPQFTQKPTLSLRRYHTKSYRNREFDAKCKEKLPKIFCKNLRKTWKTAKKGRSALLVFMSTNISFHLPVFSRVVKIKMSQKNKWLRLRFQWSCDHNLETRDQTTTLQVIRRNAIGSKGELWTIRQTKCRSTIIAGSLPA